MSEPDLDPVLLSGSELRHLIKSFIVNPKVVPKSLAFRD
jgi:hypothetical protein